MKDRTKMAMRQKKNEKDGRVAARCPNCNAEVPYLGLDKNPYFPFCRKRCKMVDLDRWLKEEYNIRSEVKAPGRKS